MIYICWIKLSLKIVTSGASAYHKKNYNNNSGHSLNFKNAVHLSNTTMKEITFEKIKTKVWILQPKHSAVFFQNKRERSGFEVASAVK